MSNPCFSSYRVTGRSQDIDWLHKVLVQLRDGDRPLVANRCERPNMWLGCLVKALGGEPDKVCCPGYVSGFCLRDDGTLAMDTVTAGCEMAEVRHFIESQFKGMKIYYFEDSREDDVLNTNDFDRRYFPTVVIIDSEGELEDDGYFDSWDAAAYAVGNLAGHFVEPNPEAIQAALDDYLEEHTDAFFSLHEVKFLDD